MNIVCLGWGSLIWNPCCLPVWGCWNCDGPVLPIEFARESKGGRITLVIAEYEGVVPVPVLWCKLCPDHITNLDKAKHMLATREGTSKCNIGFWSAAKKSHHYEVDVIGEWAQSQEIEAVVWTALKPGFNENSGFKTSKDIKRKRGSIPSLDDIKQHLQNLPESARNKAEEYVLKTPQQIRTNYRVEIENELARLHQV